MPARKEEKVEGAEVMLVEDISKVLRIARNTIHSRRWQEKSGCPVFKRGKRLYAFAPEFWKWFRKDARFYNAQEV